MRDRERYEKRVGTVVDGRWRIDGLLGWGSTSAVYAATHRNGHRAALKILHQALCSDAALTERFLREAGIANAIKHRSIVPIRDDGTTEDGCAYLVVELLEGETLEAIRERGKGRIALEELAILVEELMSAISAVHAAGVVHRDLKPQNVFVTKKGELKLLDFGTARIFDRAATSPLSVQGLVVGTPAFMSPEQARGARDEVDAQSDVWSLGALIFTVLSGQFVHAAKSARQQLLAAASKPAPELTSVAPSIDDRVAAVVDRALSRAKKDRWPDVQSMRVAFRNAVVGSVPTMRQLPAFAAVGDDDVSPGTISMSDPTLIAAAVARVGSNAEEDADDARSGKDASADDARSAKDARAGAKDAGDEKAPAVAARSESEAPAVSSTQALRVKTGIPLPALVAGCSAMAAVILLVLFFMSSGDEPASPRATALAAPTAEPPAAAVAPPSASFIVISAPDDVVEKNANAKAISPPVAPATSAVPATAQLGDAATAASATLTAPSAAPQRPAVPGGNDVEIP